MQLLQLPSELLNSIFGYVGPEYFRQDISRLAVSTRWYAFARPVLVRHLDLTATSLNLLLGNVESLKLSLPHITTIKLSFQDYELVPPGPGLFTPLDPEVSEALDEWIAQLNSNVAKLGPVLQLCRGLRSLAVAVGPGTHGRHWPPDGYLDQRPLAGLLALQHLPHLTCLDFRVAGCPSTSAAADARVHFCSSINALLPTLRRLRCQIQHVCERLLDPPASPDTPLRLEEVIINLSLSGLSDMVTSYRHALDCRAARGEPGGLSLSELQELVETQAVTLSGQLRSPRMVRVITHRPPSLRLCTFDALTGKRMVLDEGAEWDASGEVVDEHSDGEWEDGEDLFDSDASATAETA